jgi:hypothetical protein
MIMNVGVTSLVALFFILKNCSSFTSLSHETNP